MKLRPPLYLPPPLKRYGVYPEDWECPTAWYLLGSADMAGWALLDAAGVPDCEQAWTNFSLDTTKAGFYRYCLLYTSPSPRDRTRSRMPSSA